MFTPSSKIAVTCAKPLRDRDRVDCRPGIPASAFSMGQVISCSTSPGASDGASALICTWLLVMSGTASIGSFLSEYRPTAAAIAVSSTMSQRFLIEKRSSGSSMGRFLWCVL
jgi:hypothetical protein